MTDQNEPTESVAPVASDDLFGDWLPIETAPKGRKAVLVFRADRLCTFCATWDDITNEWRHFGGSSYPVGGEITHWMPLPSPPNGDDHQLGAEE
ncbi:MAG TPA: hypothetical protein DCG72_12285 [Gammaproteobacteria bacterium]|nr:hypothetical protein [Gammaproteobacteria bacterium]